MSILCNTGGWEDEHYYEKSKKAFLKMVEQKLKNHKKHRLIYELHTKPNIENMIMEKQLHPNYHPKYHVVEKDGKYILVAKTKTDSYAQILTWEEMFDKFMPLHVETGHRGGVALEQLILSYSRKQNVEYKIPHMCLYYFTRVCHICMRNNRLPQPRTGLVYVIGMTPTRDEEKFRYLLIYLDKATHYIILRPLMEKTSDEISLELFKIFTQFGPPVSLQVHGYNSTLTEQIASTLKEICSEFKIETEHQPSLYDLPTLVTDRIQDWMTRTKNTVWEMGCYIVQAEMNDDPQMKPSGKGNLHSTPRSLYFRTTEYERMQGINSTAGFNTDSSSSDCSQIENLNLTDRETEDTDLDYDINETTEKDTKNRNVSLSSEDLRLELGQTNMPTINLLESDEDIENGAMI